MNIQLADESTDLRGIATVLNQLRPQFPIAYIQKQIGE